MLLITLYNPTGEGGHQGGGVAAPVGGQIFSEVLPYLCPENKIETNKESEWLIWMLFSKNLRIIFNYDIL